MTPKITPEMREALRKQPEGPIEVEDDQSRKVYLLFDRDRASELLGLWLAQELQKGFDAADRGEITPLDADVVKTAGRMQMRSRS